MRRGLDEKLRSLDDDLLEEFVDEFSIPSPLMLGTVLSESHDYPARATEYLASRGLRSKAEEWLDAVLALQRADPEQWLRIVEAYRLPEELFKYPDEPHRDVDIVSVARFLSRSNRLARVAELA